MLTVSRRQVKLGCVVWLALLVYPNQCIIKSMFNCVAKHNLKYPYIGNSDTTYRKMACDEGSVCTSDPTDGKYATLQSRHSIAFRNVFIAPRCLHKKQNVECFVACEDMTKDLCIPYIFWNFAGWYRGTVDKELSAECTDTQYKDKSCPTTTSYRCGTFENGIGGVRCDSSSSIPCLPTCEHYNLLCSPHGVLEPDDPSKFNHYYAFNALTKSSVPIFNSYTQKCTEGMKRESAMQYLQGKSGAPLASSNVFSLNECTDANLKSITEMVMDKQSCVSEEMDLYYFRLSQKLNITIHLPVDKTIDDEQCEPLKNKKKGLCGRDYTKRPAHCKMKGGKTKPCYSVCQHDMIDCIPLYGPAYSEAQDTTTEMGHFGQFGEPGYAGTRKKTAFGDPCAPYTIPQILKNAGKSIPPNMFPATMCASMPHFVNEDTNTKMQPVSTPVCRRDGEQTVMEPCYKTCPLASDPFVASFRHLLKDEIEMLESYVSEKADKAILGTNWITTAPLIMLVPDTRDVPIKVFCDKKGRIKKILKENLMEHYACIDVELNQTAHSIVHETSGNVILHSLQIVSSNNKPQYVPSASKITDIEELIVCRDEVDFMPMYMGTVAVTTDGIKCENWATIPNSKEFNITNYVSSDEVVNHVNYCRNWNNARLGPWCYAKTADKLTIRPCFKVCNKKGLEWKKKNCLFGIQLQPDHLKKKHIISPFTRTGKRCDCEDDPVYSETNGIPCDCQYSDGDTYLGPTCSVDNTTSEHCFFACEHLQLKCINRNEMIGIEYNGPRKSSLFGRPCEQWSRVFNYFLKMNHQWKWIFSNETNENAKSKIADMFSSSKIVNHNYCLNIRTFLGNLINFQEYPGLDPIILVGPICFVNEDDFLVPQPCFNSCEDELIEKNNCIAENEIATILYTGYRNYSLSGKPCFRWDMKLANRDRMPTQYTGPLHNYCRNYGHFNIGPWCYVEHEHKAIKEECFKPCEVNEKPTASVSKEEWRIEICRPGENCIKKVATGTVQEPITSIKLLDMAWPDPMDKIIAAVEEKQISWMAAVICFGIYTVFQWAFCLIWMCKIRRQPDVQAMREKLDLEYEIKQLEQQKKLLLEKHKKMKNKHALSSKAKGSPRHSGSFSGFRTSFNRASKRSSSDELRKKAPGPEHDLKMKITE